MRPARPALVVTCLLALACARSPAREGTAGGPGTPPGLVTDAGGGRTGPALDAIPAVADGGLGDEPAGDEFTGEVAASPVPDDLGGGATDATDLASGSPDDLVTGQDAAPAGPDMAAFDAANLDAAPLDTAPLDTAPLDTAPSDTANPDAAADATGCPPTATGTCAAAGTSWEGPPAAALLPGESTACQALGIAACTAGEGAGAPFYTVYHCFDAAGKLVFQGVVDTLVSPPDAVPAALPCSQAQVQAWLQAYQAPCWQKIPATAMPGWMVTEVLDLAKVPTQVCSNVAGTRFQFQVGCSVFVYEFDCYKVPSTPPSPPFCANLGGNSWGSHWRLTVTPPTTAAFQTAHPFLACCAWSATGYGWHWTIKTNGPSIALDAADIAPAGDKPVWSDLPAKLDAVFQGCGKPYDIGP